MKRPEALGAVYDIILYELLDVLLHIDFTPPGNSPTKLIGTGELWSRSTGSFRPRSGVIVAGTIPIDLILFHTVSDFLS